MCSWHVVEGATADVWIKLLQTSELCHTAVERAPDRKHSESTGKKMVWELFYYLFIVLLCSPGLGLCLVESCLTLQQMLGGHRARSKAPLCFRNSWGLDQCRLGDFGVVKLIVWTDVCIWLAKYLFVRASNKLHVCKREAAVIPNHSPSRGPFSRNSNLTAISLPTPFIPSIKLVSVKQGVRFNYRGTSGSSKTLFYVKKYTCICENWQICIAKQPQYLRAGRSAKVFLLSPAVMSSVDAASGWKRNLLHFLSLSSLYCLFQGKQACTAGSWS